MEIRLANHTDIPGMIRLLQQVGQVHHDIRPDLFREGDFQTTKADRRLLAEVYEQLRQEKENHSPTETDS